MIRECVLAVLCVLTVLCGCAKNASTSDILPGKQPGVLIDSSRADQERLGPNAFRLSVRGFDRHMAVQENASWCWAACAETLLRHASVTRVDTGRPFNQEDLIRYFAEHKHDQSIPEESVLLSITPELWQQHAAAKTRYLQVAFNRPNGNGYVLEPAQPTIPGTAALVQEVSSGNPAILALSGSRWTGGGHIVVVYEVTYSKAGISAFARQPYFIHEVRAIDPASGNDIVLMSGDIDATDFATGRKTALQFMQESIDAMNKAHWKYVPPNARGKTIKWF